MDGLGKTQIISYLDFDRFEFLRIHAGISFLYHFIMYLVMIYLNCFYLFNIFLFFKLVRRGINNFCSLVSVFYKIYFHGWIVIWKKKIIIFFEKLVKVYNSSVVRNEYCTVWMVLEKLLHVFHLLCRLFFLNWVVTLAYVLFDIDFSRCL